MIEGLPSLRLILTLLLHRVEYDMLKVFELMDKAGFSDYYYGCLVTGARNLCKLPESWHGIDKSKL
jgi:hypothetical protein